MKRQTLVINTRDTISEKGMDALETATGCPIVAQSDDGAGNMKLYLRPKRRLTKPELKQTLKALEDVKRYFRTAVWTEE